MIHWFVEFFAQPFPLRARGLLSFAILLPLLFAPRWRLPLARAAILQWRRLARGRMSAPLLAGGCAFLGAALIGLLHTHQPWVSDEFSYLLASDTFAHGRLVNPTHPLWRFFESYHILLYPTYMSKYPPVQGFLLALGQFLTGDPRVGVWLSSGLACAALCWALRAWVGACWALAGALLMAAHLGIAGYWAQSFWGGMAAALGGALVFGAIPRLRRRWRPRDAVWLTLGAMVLANSRPFEGLLAVLAAAGYLGISLLRGGRPALRAALLTTPAALAVAIPCAVGMAYYNWRVCGSPWVMPYLYYQQIYSYVPNFFFLPMRAPPAYTSPLTAQYFQHMALTGEIGRYANMHNIWGFSYYVSMKFRGLWSYFFGPLLSLPLLLTAWTDPRIWVRRLQIALIALFFLSTAYFLNRVSLVIFLGACITQIFLMFTVCRSSAARFSLFGLCLITGGILLVTWNELPHYLAPGAPLVILFLVEALRGLSRAQWRGGALGHCFLPLWTAAVIIILTLQGTSVLLKTQGPLTSFGPDYIDRSQMSEKRAAIERELRAQPGNHLVIVSYLPGHIFDLEWVFNESDIDSARVVWAHDRGPVENRALLDYFKDRKVWFVQPERILSTGTADAGPGANGVETPGKPR